jgi:phage-related protein
MAEENTITTVFRADISQFSASTQQLNQYIRNVNSQFEVASAGLGKWSDSTDGLQAKISQLNGVLEAEKKKLDILNARYAEMEKAGKGNTKEAQNLQIAINKQVAVIKKTEKQTEDYTASLKELKDAGVNTKQELKALTDAQEKQGKSAEGLSGALGAIGKGLAAVGASAAALVGGFLSLADSTREYRTGLNQLETAFGRVGFSAEETYEAFNYFGSVLGDTRKAQETMLVLGQLVDSEKELESWTDTLTGVFATYGEAIPLESMSEAVVLASKQAVAEGGLADALEWGGVNLENFNKKLESLNSDEERAAYIQETLNGLYGEAAENYKELNKDVLDASTAQTNLEHATAKLGAVAEPIMTMLRNGMAEFLTALEPAVKMMGEGLKEALQGTAGGAEKFAEGLAGIVDTALQKFNELLPRAVDIFVQLIPALITSLLNALPSLLSTIVNIVAQIVTALGDMLPQVLAAIVAVIPQIVQALLHALPTLTGALIGFIPQLLDAAIVLFNAIVDAIPVLIQSLMVELPNIINTLVDQLIGAFPQVLQGAITLLMAIVDALPTIIKALVQELPKVVETTVKTLTSRLPELINGAVQLFMGIIAAIPQIQTQLMLQMPTIIKTIVSGLIQGIPDMLKAGTDLLDGLIKGLLNPSTIWNAVKSLGKSIVSGVKKVFGINSPSKVFENVIGKNLALGLGVGFNEEMDDVEKSMQRTLSKLTPALEISAPKVAPLNNSSGLINQLADLLNGQRGETINNYNFDYKFEKIQTSKLALHKAELATRRIVGGNL